jgi:hypothetical protein
MKRHLKVPYPVMKSELDPCSILTGLSTSQSTGCLEVINSNTTWSVFLQFGQLLNADCSVQSLGQLLHRLHYLGCEVAVQAVKATIESSGDLSYQVLVRQEIDRLAQHGLIDRAQASQVSAELTIEALESLLWLKTGSYKWNEQVGLTPHKSISKLSVSKRARAMSPFEKTTRNSEHSDHCLYREKSRCRSAVGNETRSSGLFN